MANTNKVLMSTLRSPHKKEFAHKKEFISPNLKHLKNLGSYLAGLIEGAGYICITNNRVILGICFNIKDKPLATYLLNTIGKGQGTIIKRPTKSVELRFSAKKNLVDIVNLINGEFRTPKIDQLHILIDWLNKNHFTNLDKKNLNLNDLGSDFWLAGFIEADGYFYIRHSPSKIACSFYLEQRIFYPKTGKTYENILETIACFLKGKLGIRDRKNYLNKSFIIRVENQISAHEWVKYLDRFPLKSSKYLDYLDWKKAFRIIQDKNHITEKGKQITLAHKNSINDKRTFLDWSHLFNM